MKKCGPDPGLQCPGSTPRPEAKRRPQKGAPRRKQGGPGPHGSKVLLLSAEPSASRQGPTLSRRPVVPQEALVPSAWGGRFSPPEELPPGSEDLVPSWRAHSLPPRAASPAHLLSSRQLPKCPHVYINTLWWILFPQEEHVGTPTWASTGRVADPLFTSTVRAAIPTDVVTQLEELV